MIRSLIEKYKNYIHRRNNAFPRIYHKDGFLFFIDDVKKYPSSNDQLIINPKKINSTIKYINKNNINRITINNSYYDKVENLEFLHQTTNIKQISILQEALDLKPLEALSELRWLSFTKGKMKVNLDFFPKLEYIGCDWRDVQNLNKCYNLKSLNIHFFKMPDLKELKELKKLEEISLYRTQIRNFEGIEDHILLNKVDIYNASKLQTLTGLPNSSDNLKLIYIYNAKNLMDYEILKTMPHVTRLQLVSGGQIENLEMFQKMPNLEYLQLGMEITNGDKMEFMNLIDARTKANENAST